MPTRQKYIAKARGRFRCPGCGGLNLQETCYVCDPRAVHPEQRPSVVAQRVEGEDLPGIRVVSTRGLRGVGEFWK